MKKRAVVLFVLCAILLAQVVSASSSLTINTPSKEYNITLVAVYDTNANLVINGASFPRLDEQTSKYSTLQHFIGGLYPILKLAEPSRYVGDHVSKATFIFFVEQNFTEANNFNATIKINKGEFNISATLLSSTKVSGTINNYSYYLEQSPSDYPIYDYSVNLNELKHLRVKEIYTPRYATDPNPPFITLLLGFEVNLTEDCLENWDCSDWSSCSENQQTRTCADSNNCGTAENKPAEMQSCGSPTPIECDNDEDCFMPSAGMPYCSGNKFCVPYASYKCINAGTEQSYCNATSAKSCTPCANGCEVNHCINQSQPAKECETIGLRQKGKYCSPQYQLINQKANGASCENSFECKINSCLDSKCGKEHPSNLIYWIIGIIAVLAIIGFIIYALIPK